MQVMAAEWGALETIFCQERAMGQRSTEMEDLGVDIAGAWALRELVAQVG
jgi:hypothetical protein